MSKRIITTFLSSIIVAMFFLTSAFLIISNLQKLELVSDKLETNNEVIINYMEAMGVDPIVLLRSVNESFRMTLIDERGNVVFDSSGNDAFQNHLLREEIVDAFSYGTGSDVRVSESLGIQMVYFATRLPDGRFIRSSMETGSLDLGNQFTKYMGVAFLLVILLAYFLAQRISNYLVEPINEMAFATERIASGEYTRRVRVRRDAELGRLGTNFNNMAETLENTFLEKQEKQNRLEAILRSMNSGVFAYDNQDQIIMINPFCKELFGIYGNVIGKNIYDIKELRELIFMLEPEHEMVEVRIEKPIRKDIRIKSAEIFGERVSKVGTVVVLEDITDLKKLEKMRSQFVANVSHELKTPLTSIKGFSETLKFVKDEETRNKFLDIINDESERLTRLINDILSLSTIEQTRTIKNEEIDAGKETETVYNLLMPKAESKDVHLNLIQKESVVIYGDRDNYKQLIMNLVDNAIKYTKESGEVTITIDKEGDNLKLVIEDTGVGIPEKHLSRIFERFYRVDKARDRAMGGTGLGLAIVKHIVLLMEGTIDVESEIGKGTTFIITIPIKSTEE